MLARLNAGRLAARRGARPVAATLLSAAVLGGALTACGNPPILERIKQCESGGNYRAVNPSSGAAGAYQFMYTTWRALPESRGYSNASYAPSWLTGPGRAEPVRAMGTRPWDASRACWAGEPAQCRCGAPSDSCALPRRSKEHPTRSIRSSVRVSGSCGSPGSRSRRSPGTGMTRGRCGIGALGPSRRWAPRRVERR